MDEWVMRNGGKELSHIHNNQLTGLARELAALTSKGVNGAM